MISVAVDFDGTLVEDNFPAIGSPKTWVINLVKRLQKAGVKTILWTCRRDSDGNNWLTQAVSWCEENGLFFDAVNQNLPEVQAKWGGDTRKVLADFYLDDKNFGYNQIRDLKRFVEAIEKRGR